MANYCLTFLLLISVQFILLWWELYVYTLQEVACDLLQFHLNQLHSKIMALLQFKCQFGTSTHVFACQKYFAV